MLTDKHKLVLSFIQSYISENGCSPKAIEIGEGTGIRSISSICLFIADLENEGYIASKRRSRQAKDIKVLKMPA
jgi:SOS-response transcriptional repressor LexA